MEYSNLRHKFLMHKKWVLIVIAVIAVLLLLSAGLPYFVTRYINRVLNNMPDYGGSVADVDISLYRGAYAIDELKIFKTSGNKEIPFIDIPRADFSVEWKALFEGGITGEAVLQQPTINFINKEQAGEKIDWAKKIEDLFPIRINRFEVVNGTVTYLDFSTEPKVDLRLAELNIVATNFANVEEPADTEDREQTGNQETAAAENARKEALPATVMATATSIGGGQLKVDMRLNPLKRVPDLDMDFRFENVNMPALNDFFRAYAKVDVERGNFSVYSEMTINDGIVRGYVKPVAENVEILDREKDDQNAISLIWQSIVEFATEIFKNKSEDQLATQVPLSGDLNNVETSVWAAIWNIFSNGFVQAFNKSTNNSIEFGDSPKEGEEASKNGG